METTGPAPSKRYRQDGAAQQDYDSPWKEILTRFFPHFMAFFFPDIHAAIDWPRGFEFLDKELQKIAVKAALGRRLADKLVKVYLLDGREVWVLIHIEVQGKRERGFALRMFVYHYRIFDSYAKKVVSLAILTDDDPRWRPSEFGYDLFETGLRLKFRAVKLLDYTDQWEALAASKNPFAVVAMAHLKALETRRSPQLRFRWKLELVKGLYERGYETEDVRQLFRFIDWLMMLPEELEKKLEDELAEFEEERRMEYLSGMERRAIQRGLEKGMQQGLQQGLEQGLEQGAASIVLRQLLRRLGELKPSVIRRVETLPLEKLEQLSEALLDFTSAKDLKKWLKEHAPARRKAKAKELQS
jgi:hypothetical protein